MPRLAPSILALALFGVTGCQSTSQTTTVDAKDRALASYGVGWYLGLETREGVELDKLNANFDLLARGFHDAVHAKKPLYDEEAMDEVLELVHMEMAQRAIDRLLEEDADFKQLHDGNLETSRIRVAEFGRKPDAQALDCGIQYVVLDQGRGPVAASAKTVVFDFSASALDREIASGEGIVRDVDDLLPGTVEILTHMRVGDRWSVAIPPELAFGPAGDPPFVGPNEAIFGIIALREVRR